MQIYFYRDFIYFETFILSVLYLVVVHHTPFWIIIIHMNLYIKRDKPIALL